MELLQAGGSLSSGSSLGRLASEGTMLSLLRELQHLVTTHGQAACVSWIPIHGLIIPTLLE